MRKDDSFGGSFLQEVEFDVDFKKGRELLCEEPISSEFKTEYQNPNLTKKSRPKHSKLEST